MDWNKVFTYDAEKGELIRKPKPYGINAYTDAWNKRYAGKPAGSINIQSGGAYKRKTVRVNGVAHGFHNVVAAMHDITLKAGEVIDHIDGDATNNRIENLRVATHSENCCNQKLNRCNTLRLKGVSRVGGIYAGRIKIKGNSIYLGTFPTKGLAAVARAKAALRIHGKFARLT